MVMLENVRKMLIFCKDFGMMVRKEFYNFVRKTGLCYILSNHHCDYEHVALLHDVIIFGPIKFSCNCNKIIVT